jgi:hypothetical protein
MLGSAAVSLLVFSACAAGVARKNLFVALFAGLTILAWRVCDWHEASSLDPLPRKWRLLFGSVYCAYGLLYFLSAAQPEFSPDGSSYHLGLVAHYIRAHGFFRITTNMYANLSQGVEMLFVPAFGIGRHSAAALVHCAFLFALPLLILNYARRCSYDVAGICAALIVFAAPVIGKDGTSAYNDVAAAAAIFTVFYLVETWRLTGLSGLVPLAGIAAGFCYATKYTAFLAVPYALWVIARKRFHWRPLAVFSACAAVSILPWMLKNWIWLGNPVSPFFNKIFPNPFVYIAFEQEYTRMMRVYEGISSYWQIPREVTIGGGPLAGFLGPAFVLAPLAILALRERTGRRVLAAALIFGVTYFGNIGTRFLIPAAPFIALGICIALSRSRTALAAVALLHAVLSLPGVNSLYCGEYAWRLEWPDWRVALRLRPEEPFLIGHLGAGYLAARTIDRVVPEGEEVFSFTPLPEAYTSRMIVTGFQSARGKDMVDIVEGAMWKDFAPEAREYFQFPETKTSRLRIRQTAAGMELWSLSEVRLYHSGEELPRKTTWRIRANAHPWGIQLAFDNSLVTRWRSWEPLHPRMYVEIDLGESVAIDRVVMETTHDHYQAKVLLEALDASGNWHVIDSASDFEQPEEVKGLRKAAGQMLKQMGIRYWLLFDSDYTAEDFRKHSADWGVEVVGEMPGALLYKFK